MAKLLFHSDLPFINEHLKHERVQPYFNGGQPIEIQDTINTIFYKSDDEKDIACFERLDQRVHAGHNAFTNNIKQALINAKDIISHHFMLFPNLELIVGYTPYNLTKTRLFNIKLGFKLVNLQYNQNDTLCYRYELRRDYFEANTKRI